MNQNLDRAMFPTVPLHNSLELRAPIAAVLKKWSAFQFFDIQIQLYQATFVYIFKPKPSLEPTFYICRVILL